MREGNRRHGGDAFEARDLGKGRRSAAGLLALLVLGVQGCGACESEEVVASIEGPPPVEWFHTRVWRQHEGGGRGSLPIPGLVDRDFLRIGAEPEVEADVDCHEPEPELAVEPTRRLVAYRCGSAAAWRIVHMGSPPVVDPTSTLGGATQPDWRLAPDVVTSVANVLDQAALPANVEEVVERVRARDGPAALAQLLVRTSTREAWDRIGRTETRPEGWSRFFASLPPAEQEAVRAGLRPLLDGPAFDFRLLRHALVAFPPTDGAATAKLVARTKQMDVEGHWEIALAVRDLARRVAPSQPEEAGALVCHLLDAHDWTASDEEDLLVIAATAVTCTATSPHVSCSYMIGARGCAPADGPWRPCSPEELQPRLAEAFAAWIRSEPARADGLRAGDYMLAIALRHGTVPSEYEKAARWRGFAVEQPDEPDCYVTTEPDRRCRCWILSGNVRYRQYDRVLCDAAADPPAAGAVHSPSTSNCRFRVDEARRVVEVLGPRPRPTARAPGPSSDAPTPGTTTGTPGP